MEKEKISRNTKKKWVCLAVVIIIILVLGILAVYLMKVNSYQKSVKNMAFQDINISEVPDGSYTGSCDVDFISAKVKVTVHSGKIEKIELLEHKNERGAAAERVVDDMVNQQSLNVDAVSGATNSSKVIRKAVENALSNKK